jgi:hypothetical protein
VLLRSRLSLRQKAAWIRARQVLPGNYSCMKLTPLKYILLAEEVALNQAAATHLSASLLPAVRGLWQAG